MLCRHINWYDKPDFPNCALCGHNHITTCVAKILLQSTDPVIELTLTTTFLILTVTKCGVFLFFFLRYFTSFLLNSPISVTTLLIQYFYTSKRYKLPIHPQHFAITDRSNYHPLQSMEWTGLIRWIHNPVPVHADLDWTGSEIHQLSGFWIGLDP